MKWCLGRVVVFVCGWFVITTNVFAQQWQSPYGHDHVLTGKIWDSRAEQWIPGWQWLQQLRSEKIILLGETHTNEDHHRLQAMVLDDFHRHQRIPELVFEMFPSDVDETKLNDWQTLDQLNETVAVLGPRWPWARYQALLNSIYKHRQRMSGANLNAHELASIAEQHGSELLREGLCWNVEDALNSTQSWQMGVLIQQAHCGYVSQQRLPRSINIQIARDLSFALTLAQSFRNGQTSIMIVGAGHVRKDFAIPLHLRRMGISSASVLFAPVVDGLTSVDDYIPATNATVYDFIYFTANSFRDDPCVEFAQQLKQLKMEEKRTHAR